MRLGDLAPDLRAHGHRCWKKQRQTKGKAEAHHRQLIRTPKGALDADRTRVYHCGDCGAGCPQSAHATCTHWHVGRLRDGEKEQQR